MLAQRTGVETLAPRFAVRHARRDGATATTTEALFPGYLFARLRLPDDLRFAVSSPDVTGLVHFGEHIPDVPDSLIDLFRCHASGERTCAPLLVPGDWIEVLTGCLAGTEGRLLSFDSGRGRAWVLLALLGQDLRICLPAGALRHTGPTHLDFPPQLLASCG